MLDIAQPQRVLAALLQSSEDATLSVSPAGTILSWSIGAERLYGFAEQEVVGRPLMLLLPGSELSALDTQSAKHGNGDGAAGGSFERVRKDGKKILVAIQRTVVRNESGEVMLVLEKGRQLDGHKLQAGAKHDLDTLLAQTPILLWSTDRNLKVTSHWGGGVPWGNLRPNERVGCGLFELFQGGESSAMLAAQHNKALRGVTARFEYLHENRVLDIQLGPLRSFDGEIEGCVGVGMDITDRKRNEESMRFQATHDHLTGLANYRVFADTLDRELRRAYRTHQPFAVMLLDLDGLKNLNDSQGHLAGNRALKRVARVMSEHCRSTDLAARYGGDEFALIMIDSDRSMAEHVARRIESCLESDPESPVLSVSIGFSNFPQDGKTVQELLETADRRLYQRKQTRRARGSTAR